MSKNRMIFCWFDENKFTHEENSQSLKEVNNARTLEPVLNYMLNVINEKTRLIRWNVKWRYFVVFIVYFNHIQHNIVKINWGFYFW